MAYIPILPSSVAFVYNYQCMKPNISFLPNTIVTKSIVIIEFYKMIHELIKSHIEILTFEHINSMLECVSNSTKILSTFNNSLTLRKQLGCTELGKVMKTTYPHFYHEESVGENTLLSTYIELLSLKNRKNEFLKYEDNYKELMLKVLEGYYQKHCIMAQSKIDEDITSEISNYTPVIAIQLSQLLQVSDEQVFIYYYIINSLINILNGSILQ